MDKRLLRNFHRIYRFRLRWSHPRDFVRMAREGVFAIYGDAFEYLGSAVVLIGMPGAGKTSTVGRFVRSNNRLARRLSYDSTTSSYDGKRLYVYKTSTDLRVTVPDMDLTPVIRGDRGYSLAAIVYLSRDRRLKTVQPEDLEAALNMMFGAGVSYHGRFGYNGRAIAVSRRAYGGVPIFRLPRCTTPDERYYMLKELVVGELYLDKR